MSKSVNQVTLVGNLTRDPELRTTPNGLAVCNFSLALNRSYKDTSGEWIETADYVDVVAWTKLAERVSQYLNKGSKCVIIGRLQSRSWEQDGHKRSKLEVLATEAHFLEAQPTDNIAQSTGRETDTQLSAAMDETIKNPTESTKTAQELIDDPISLDDIPF